MIPKNFYVTPEIDEMITKILGTGKYVTQSELFRDCVIRRAEELGVA